MFEAEHRPIMEAGGYRLSPGAGVVHVPVRAADHADRDEAASGQPGAPLDIHPARQQVGSQSLTALQRDLVSRVAVPSVRLGHPFDGFDRVIERLGDPRSGFGQPFTRPHRRQDRSNEVR
ncbi:MULTISPECIES: hypothetical protein [unclassified Nonomuraea]